MISHLRLRFGRAPGSSGDAIATTPITVFVGPNNSGKSKVLAEIHHFCRTGQKQPNTVIVEDLSFDTLTPEGAERAIGQIKLIPGPGEAINPDHILVGGRHSRMHVPLVSLRQVVTNPTSNVSAFCQWFLAFSTLMLDGPSRIILVSPQTGGDLQQPPISSFQVLFRDDAKRSEVRRIVSEAFGSFFVIDPTNLGQLRVRLSDRAPIDDLEERGIHPAAVRFHANAQPIEFSSDGVKAFTGIITELIAGDPKVVLVDEPEAFLHPSLAFKLGHEVSRAAIETDKKIFVSTHSPTFVMGCIQSGAPVNIVRLTYRSNVATARLLPSNELLELMRNPLLRSTGVLSGLFYEFVIVTESDTDRAFYQEVNERLLRYRSGWGIPNCLFINAQNKQTVQTIIAPLRKLGIPAAGVVDVDVFKDGGSTWTKLLASAHVPAISHQPLGAMRSALLNTMNSTGRDMKREGGISILAGADLEAAKNLLEQLAEYGIFVVPSGELESWLPTLGATGKGPAWLIDVFERMGEDPDATAYLKPSDGDVWKFLSGIKDWLTDPTRKGIPA